MVKRSRPWFGAPRRLRKRGTEGDGLTVDLQGVTLGRDLQLVRRTPEGYRAISREEIASRLRETNREANPARLARHLESIAKALNAKDLARARILGLYFPIEELTPGRRDRLKRASPLVKQNFNPAEARDERGRWTSGELASGGMPRPTRKPSPSGTAAGARSTAKEPVATFATLDDAAKAAAGPALAAAEKDRDRKHEFAGSIYPVPGGFSFDGPHLVILNAEDKGDFTARPDAVSWYHTHRDYGDPSRPDKDFQTAFEARGGKPAYIFTVPLESGEPGGIIRFSSHYPNWYEIVQ